MEAEEVASSPGLSEVEALLEEAQASGAQPLASGPPDPDATRKKTLLDRCWACRDKDIESRNWLPSGTARSRRWQSNLPAS